MTAEPQRGRSSDEPDLLAQLRDALGAAGLGPTGLEIPPQADPHGRTLAAALVLLYPWRRPGETGLAPYLVLTRRTTTMKRHSGQISLPGGRFDQEDGSLLRTALRETEEELGVDPASLTVWGRLDPEWIVVSHYLVAPFVAYTPRRPQFRPAPAEVAEVIEMPLALLLDPASLAEEIWELQGTPRQVSFYRHGEHKVWGATARILGQLAALIEPGRVDPGAFPGAAGETGREPGFTPGSGPGHQPGHRRLAPGDVWPRSTPQPPGQIPGQPPG